MKIKKKGKKSGRDAVYSNARRVSERQDQGRGLSTFKLPKGYELFKFKKGMNTFDILPFRVSKKNYRVRSKDVKEGQAHYECTFFIHKGIGPEEKWVICPRESFGKDCSVCNYMRKKMKANALSEDDRKALSPKERQLFIVRDHDDDRKKKILENSHFRGFGELLKDKLLAVPETHYYQNFFHLTDGCTLSVRAKDIPMGTGSFVGPVNIEMEKRKKPIDMDLNKIPCLDKYLIEMETEDLEELFLEGRKSDKKKGKEKEEDEDDDDDDDEGSDDGDEDDDEDSESEGDDSDDDEDSEDEDAEEDEGDEEEEEEQEDIEVGSTVKFKYKKKRREGTVVKIKKGLYHVQCEDKDIPYVMREKELTLVPDEEDEDDGDD